MLSDFPAWPCQATTMVSSRALETATLRLLHISDAVYPWELVSLIHPPFPSFLIHFWVFHTRLSSGSLTYYNVFGASAWNTALFPKVRHVTRHAGQKVRNPKTSLDSVTRHADQKRRNSQTRLDSVTRTKTYKSRAHCTMQDMWKQQPTQVS
jgi:hypothetical protein